ncbi:MULTISPECIES: porin [Delftia]|uniref:Porin n=1 Tax=Delftia acidovorans TaxID=80866 RepID=A0A7T2VY64_DELAC|nr:MULTISPECIES: porin [Delftia]QPS07766.1 porin [Delftia acidovorans]
MNSSTLISAALLCAVASPPASAQSSTQSSVEIYGKISMGFGRANPGTSSAANTGQGKPGASAMQQGQASLLGFRGREDLGDGLYARFKIEHRFSPDTGTPTFPTFWQGGSIVAIGHKRWGEVYLGRENTPAYNVAITADPTFWSYVSQLGAPYTYAGFNASAINNGGVLTSMDGTAIRHSNTVGYKSPSFGGFSGEFAVAAGEGNRKRVYGLNLQYRQGPVMAGLGFDGWDAHNRLYIASASYNFGVLRPIVSVGSAKGGAIATYAARSATFSVEAPLKGVGRAYGGIGRLDPAGTRNTSVKLFAGYEHSLSQRTSLYVNVGSAKTEMLTRATAWDIGMTHSF